MDTTPIEPQDQQQDNQQDAIRQLQQPSRLARLKEYLTECARVLKVTKKPGAEEYKTIVKVSGLGIAIIGLIGFILQMGKQLLL
ncbi:protein translocase SEC61 complex subunit gamma [Candidatus Woesearchaeota archaeon]|nr:protein translocase SEC61 complex subunit gamma [Candidatus Woesearchaeota archaeon]